MFLAMRSWRTLAETITNNVYARIFLIIASLAGTAFGFYYYYDQLVASPLWRWPFIPDSPIATAIYALALALASIKRRSNKVDSVAFILMTKIGIWTTVVLIVYRDHYFTPDTIVLRGFILATHLLIIAMAVLLLPDMKMEKLWFYAALASILLALDWIDYALGAHPWMPDTYIAEIGWLTVFLSLASVSFLAFWQARGNRGQRAPQR